MKNIELSFFSLLGYFFSSKPVMSSSVCLFGCSCTCVRVVESSNPFTLNFVLPVRDCLGDLTDINFSNCCRLQPLLDLVGLNYILLC